MGLYDDVVEHYQTQEEKFVKEDTERNLGFVGHKEPYRFRECPICSALLPDGLYYIKNHMRFHDNLVLLTSQ